MPINTVEFDLSLVSPETGEYLTARAYTVDGRYPGVVKALKTLAERKMAAIPMTKARMMGRM